MKFLRDNGLSLAFVTMFLASLTGQAIAGHALHAEDPSQAAPAPGLIGYIGSAKFLSGVFSNWQAALLQLLALIVLAIFLRQRGATHSRKPVGETPKHPLHPLVRTGDSDRSWAYRNSLSLAFFTLFVIVLTLFFLSDLAVYRAERAQANHASVSALEFLGSARFWFDLLQTWQAEFFAMALFLVLTIFLRQEGSAESKQVGAADSSTGGAQE